LIPCRKYNVLPGFIVVYYINNWNKMNSKINRYIFLDVYFTEDGLAEVDA
jgi:hypothetical protein